jgi:pyruvate dehydrogenase E1 component alpha subunit
VQRASANADLHLRGQAYGIPGVQVDGMDVLSVKAAAAEALERARAGEGPTILEMMTYRYRGHSMSDPAKYRSKEEVAKMRETHDPIDLVRKKIDAIGGVSEDDFKAIDKEIRGIVNDAAEFAQQSPEPDPSELYTDVLIEA